MCGGVGTLIPRISLEADHEKADPSCYPACYPVHLIRITYRYLLFSTGGRSHPGGGQGDPVS